MTGHAATVDQHPRQRAKLLRSAQGIPCTISAANCALGGIRERIGREIIRDEERDVPEREIRIRLKTLAPTCRHQGTLMEVEGGFGDTTLHNSL